MRSTRRCSRTSAWLLGQVAGQDVRDRPELAEHRLALRLRRVRGERRLELEARQRGVELVRVGVGDEPVHQPRAGARGPRRAPPRAPRRGAAARRGWRGGSTSRTPARGPRRCRGRARRAGRGSRCRPCPRRIMARDVAHEPADLLDQLQHVVAVLGRDGASEQRREPADVGAQRGVLGLGRDGALGGDAVGSGGALSGVAHRSSSWSAFPPGGSATVGTPTDCAPDRRSRHPEGHPAPATSGSSPRPVRRPWWSQSVRYSVIRSLRTATTEIARTSTCRPVGATPGSSHGSSRSWVKATALLVDHPEPVAGAGDAGGGEVGGAVGEDVVGEVATQGVRAARPGARRERRERHVRGDPGHRGLEVAVAEDRRWRRRRGPVRPRP